jgi:hypothetical protein
LPRGFRREQGQIQQLVKTGDSTFWVKLLSGDVYGPILDKIGNGGFALNFTYEFARRRYEVRINQPDFPSDPGAISSFAARQHVIVDDQNATAFRRFILAWIEEIRSHNLERTEEIWPWGYAMDDQGNNTGAAVGGTIYRPDGSTEPVPGGDTQIVRDYDPRGSLKKWQQAFKAVCENRIDLQIMVACSFGSPLMYFTGQPGLVVSAWSASGVGKSAAMRVSQAAWSAPKTMSTTSDTLNSTMALLAMTRFIVFNWDEMQVGKESGAIVRSIMDFTQGKGKRRMRADVTLRDVGEWQSLVVCAANKPLMEHVENATAGHDAGAVRVFEYYIKKPLMENTSAVARLVSQVDRNYGHAGRAFIAHVATNMQKIDAMVSGIQAKLEKKLNTTSEERFYIAGVAAIIAGAEIANSLGLTTFDVKGISKFLQDQILVLRAKRESNLLTSGQGLNAEQILAEFHNDMLPFKMITPSFPKRGPLPKHWLPLVQPIGANARVEQQIAIAEAVLRINKSTFIGWCKKRGLSPHLALEALRRQLQATEETNVLGAGTDFATGRLAVINLDLKLPDLVDYVPQVRTPAPAAKPVSQPGNKPKV